MTRQHFELIARVLRDAPIDTYVEVLTDNDADVEEDRLAVAFADELATANPRFDRARFLAACGVEA